MTALQFLTWAILVAAGAAVLIVGLKYVHLISRLTFIERIERLRDRCKDLVLAGELEPTDSVALFLTIQDVLVNESMHFSASRTGLEMMTFKRAGYELAELDLGFEEDLAPDQRAVVEGLENETRDAIRRFLFTGSPLGWLILLIEAGIRRLLGVPKGQSLDEETIRAYQVAADEARQIVARERARSSSFPVTGPTPLPVVSQR
jgi:hypothetical protein